MQAKTILSAFAVPRSPFTTAVLLVALVGCRSEHPEGNVAGTRAEQLAPAQAEPAAAARQPSAFAVPNGLGATREKASVAREPKPGGDDQVVSFNVDGVAANDALNIRSNPDPAAALVGAIPARAVAVEGLGMPSTVGQTTWQRVRHGGVVGWVNARFLKPMVATDPPNPNAKGAGVLQPLYCFGTEPFWALEFGADGSATCSQSCQGPSGLRVVNVQTSPTGDPEGFDILTGKGDVYVRAVMDRTGACGDGMSDGRHPFFFSAVGVPGHLSGCCRVKDKKAH